MSITLNFCSVFSQLLQISLVCKKLLLEIVEEAVYIPDTLSVTAILKDELHIVSSQFDLTQTYRTWHKRSTTV